MKIKMIIFSLFLGTVLSCSAYAQESYVTPDSWSKNITASGIRRSSDPKTLPYGLGNISMGLTTRFQMKAADGENYNGFQYARARLSNMEIGSGTLDANLNMRLGIDFNRNRDNPREYYVFYDALDVEAGRADAAFRLYQGNIIIRDVIKGLRLNVGRTYLDNLGGYKIDGGELRYSFFDDAFTMFGYYGLPVSYYSDLKTQAAGGGFDVKLAKFGTRMRLEFDYFTTRLDEYNSTDMLVTARLDQRIWITNVYGEISQLKDTTRYQAGIDGNFEKTRTGFSAYLSGQYGRNGAGVNPYISMMESVTGRESEHFMWGAQAYQGITDYAMVSIGYEQRYNFEESYADRDYYRISGSVDLIGLIHRDNFVSLFADYWIVPKYNTNPKDDKLSIGARMTQRIIEQVDIWAGATINAYSYSINPIQLNPLYDANLTAFETGRSQESTTAAYIGAEWRALSWLSAQADYTYQVTNIFSEADSAYDNCHTVALWLNLYW